MKASTAAAILAFTASAAAAPQTGGTVGARQVISTVVADPDPPVAITTVVADPVSTTAVVVDPVVTTVLRAAESSGFAVINAAATVVGGGGSVPPGGTARAAATVVGGGGSVPPGGTARAAATVVGGGGSVPPGGTARAAATVVGGGGSVPPGGSARAAQTSAIVIPRAPQSSAIVIPRAAQTSAIAIPRAPQSSLIVIPRAAQTSAIAIPRSPQSTPQASRESLFSKRADFPIPASQGSVTYDAAEEISGSFDGGMKTYGRGVSCTGQDEGGDSDAVFILKDGATLKNAIIGADQIEGVHCEGSCTIENVWWEAVCEDALSLKGDGDATVSGGGATGAEDKVIQHNGAGTVTIDGFTVVDFGKLYRACGNCQESAERHVVIKNVVAESGKVLAGINSNFGDTATISGTCATDVSSICTEFQGTTPGNEPEEISEGPSNACKYTESEIQAC